MVGFDEYDFKARIVPGLLGFLAVAFQVVSLGWKKYPVIAVGGGLLLGAGGAYLLAVLVRRQGNRIEPEVWASWGGPPTTRFLRLRDSTENPIQRDVWRAAAQKVTDIQFLSLDREVSDPAEADRTIEVAVSQLRRFGQDPTYPLVKAENISYGFERNLLAIRWAGRIIAIVCVAGLLVALEIMPQKTTSTSDLSQGALIVGLGIEVICLLTWIFIPSRTRTQAAADRYARQLLHATVTESKKTRESS